MHRQLPVRVSRALTSCAEEPVSRWLYVMGAIHACCRRYTTCLLRPRRRVVPLWNAPFCWARREGGRANCRFPSPHHRLSLFFIPIYLCLYRPRRFIMCVENGFVFCFSLPRVFFFFFLVVGSAAVTSSGLELCAHTVLHYLRFAFLRAWLLFFFSKRCAPTELLP